MYLVPKNAAHDSTRKQTITPLQETKKKQMGILKQKKARFGNYEEDITTSMNLDSTSVI